MQICQNLKVYASNRLSILVFWVHDSILQGEGEHIMWMAKLFMSLFDISHQIHDKMVGLKACLIPIHMFHTFFSLNHT